MTQDSYVVGEAEVRFGGAVKLQIGTNEKRKMAALLISELKEAKKPGTEMTKEEYANSFDPQVQLIFNNLESLRVFRDALNLIEIALKEMDVKDDFSRK